MGMAGHAEHKDKFENAKKILIKVSKGVTVF
jgi:hypothetical protein